VTFVDERRSDQSYTLRLRFLGDRVTADEQGAFGYFGGGAHLAGEYHRPTPDLVSDRATPAVASQRVTIREKSAAEILANLKGITLSYEFQEKCEDLYVGRWTREPGWQATVHDLPSKLPGGAWFCSFREVGSGTLVTASTIRDVSTLRPGDSVTVSGKISRVSQLESVSLEDAIVRDDNVLTRIDILQNHGWIGAEWEQKFLAYDGPLEGLRLIEDRPFQQAMATALAAQGFRPHLSEIKNLATHADEGSRVVHLTDQKTWRQRLTRGMAVLTARPADSPA
jgi:hypothetical protein